MAEIAANSVVVSPVITSSGSLSNGSNGFDLNDADYALLSTDSDCWIQIDFGVVKSIARMRLRGGPDQAGTQAMTVQTSPDGSNWTIIASWTGQANYAAISVWHDVNRADVRYIRVTKAAPNYFRLFCMGVELMPSAFTSSAKAYKRLLSGSTSGKAIKLTQAATPGDVIHTAVAGVVPGTVDEVWLWAYNGHTANVVLTIEFGGAVVPDQNIVVTIPFKSGLIPVVPGLILQNEMAVKAFASVADMLTISGFVNTITD
jgi:hypothetical protein